MRDEQHRFLSLLGQVPARLTAEETAWILGCQPHDVPILTSSRLLRPIGNPQSNAIKYYCTAEVLELVKNRSWLAKATNTVSQHWQNKNARKKGHHANGAQNGLSPVLHMSEGSGTVG